MPKSVSSALITPGISSKQHDKQERQGINGRIRVGDVRIYDSGWR